MFYCTDILKLKQGKFGAIWLAACYGKDIKKKLKKEQINRVNIIKACTDVLHPTVRFSLRLEAYLMIGILRVYKEQVAFFCHDIKVAWEMLQKSTQVNMRLIDLPPRSSKNVVTLPDPVSQQVLGHFDDFPRELIMLSPSDLFLRDADFPQHSPALGTPTSPLSPHVPRDIGAPLGLHQAPKEEITLPDVQEFADSIIQIPGEDTLSPPVADDIDFETMVTEERTTSLPGDEERPADEERPPEEDVVQILDEQTGELSPTQREEPERSPAKRQEPADFETPSDARLEPVMPSPPKKKKQQPIDEYRTMSDQRLKHNIQNVRKTLRDRIVDLPVKMTARELLTNPAMPALRRAPFIDMWRENAVTIPRPDEEVHYHPAYVEHQIEYEFESPEQPRRARTLEGSEYEKSTTGSISHLETPGSPAPGEARGPTPDLSRDQSSIGSAVRGADLPPIAELPEADFPDLSELPEIQEMQEMPDLSDIEDEPFEHMRLVRHLVEIMGDDEQTSFSKVFPPSQTRKIDAAKALFQLLAWHREGKLALSQPAGGLSEIYIERGRIF